MIFTGLVAVLVTFLVIIYIVKLYFMLSQKNYRGKDCMVGKVAIVTGGSSGIGYQIVLELAARGCKVIIADRIVDKAIKEEIIKKTNNPNISLKYVNLALFSSVRAFAEDIKKSEDKLDILINNAGVARGVSFRTEDNINLTMQVNYYSAFLLTHLLLDLLKKSSGGRIIFTTSLIAFVHPLSLSSVPKDGIEKGYEFFSYPLSKFCQISASEMFAQKLKSCGITSNCFHPFIANTDIIKNTFKGAEWYEYFGAISLTILGFFTGKNAEDAAQTGIYLACSNEVKDITGGLFENTKLMPKPLKATDKEFCEAIWRESERVVNLKPSEKLI